MGGSGSKSQETSGSEVKPRELVVEYEGVGLTKDVWNKVAGGGPSPVKADTATTERLEELEADYKARLKQLEELAIGKVTDSLKTTEEVFKKAVEETEQKFVKSTGSPVCQDLQNKVFQCYRDNPKQTLNCSKDSSAFVACVDKARQNVASNRG